MSAEAKRMIRRHVKTLTSERYGCTYRITGGGHVRITAPDGRALTCSRSPGDVNAVRTFVRDVRKYLGIQL